MTTRRNFLTLTTAAVIPPAAIGTASMNGLPNANPDALLLAACAAFDDLEQRYQQSYDGAWDDTREGIAAEAERERLVEAQEPFLATISATPAKTTTGLQAKARSLVLWDDFAMTDNPACTHDRIRSSLLRDVLNGSAAA